MNRSHDVYDSEIAAMNDEITRLRSENDYLKRENLKQAEIISSFGPPEHIIEFTDGKWWLMHPVGCRPHLLECAIHLATMSAQPPDPRGRGGGPRRYTVTLVNGALSYEKL